MDTPYKSSLKQYIGEITAGMANLSLLNDDIIPGKIKITGSNLNVWPFLMTKKNYVYLAGAELGKGRVIAASHDIFAAGISDNKGNHPEIQTLQNNIFSWLSRGMPEKKDVIILTSLRQLLKIPEDIKLIIYDGRYLHGSFRSIESKLQNFIQNGGGFLHSITPWGYLQIYSGSIIDLPFHGTLKLAGLSYLEDYISSQGEDVNEIRDLVPKNYVDFAVEENVYADYRTKLQCHSSNILNGITLLPNPGAPGFLMAYSDEAFPQVISDDGRILIAAAEISSGRLIGISHNGFIEDLLDGSNQNQQVKKMQENMIKWLSKEVITDRSMFQKSILEITNDESINQITNETKIVFWNQSEASLSVESEDKILEYVKNGGGLLHSVNPWAYYSYTNPDKMPLHEVLKKGGLTYSDKTDVMYGNDTGFPVNLNQDYFCGLQRANLAQACLNDEEFLVSGTILPFAKYLPAMVTARPDFMEKLLLVHNNNLHDFKNPTMEDPVNTNKEKSLVVLNDLLSRQMVPGFEIALGAEHFPGKPNEDLNNPKKVDLDLISDAGRADIFFTGFYLQAGKSLKINVNEGSSNGWFVKIGAHTDILWPDYQPEIKRYSHVATLTALVSTETDVSSPYGGLIYFESPNNSTITTLKVRLRNVMQAPYIDIKDFQSVKLWDERKLSPAPWADICGEYISITLPRTSVQTVSNLSNVMRMWDRIIRQLHFLRGTDIVDYRREWIVADVQPSVGYMHSGYPIVTHLDIADPDNSSFILGGNWGNFWGFYHELGHNFQRDAWTFDGTLEVTCNIFSMFCIENVTGNSPMNGNWIREQIPYIISCLQSDEYSFSKWKEDALLAVGIYAELCEHLGWGCMCHVLRQYESMDGDHTPSNDQQKMDTWFVIYSQSASVNLAPLFKFWEWPISTTSQKEVSNLVPFLPDDEITRSVPIRVESIKLMFPELKRNVEKIDFPYLFEPKTVVTNVQYM